MNSTDDTEKVDGYDLPVYGKGNDTFYAIHIPALVCISLSFCSVVIVLVLSFRRQSYKKFFTWSKSERFVVYLAICDGGYNVFHFADHLNYAIAQDHVKPKELCEFYAFTLAVFIMSQILMVNVVAINAFMLMFFEKKDFNFGRYDYRLLCWAYGAPFLGATIAAIAGKMGPNGSFCFFDGVKGILTNLLFTTVPLIIIIIANTVMYILTWYKIKQQTKRMRKHQLESARKTGLQIKKSTSQQVAKIYSLFVVAFFVQWWSLALLGVWGRVDPDVPQTIYHFVTTLTNLGGVFNLIIYTIMRRRLLVKGEMKKQKKSKATVTSDTDNSATRMRSQHDSGRGTDDDNELSKTPDTA